MIMAFLEVCKVAEHLHHRGSGMGASRDHCRKEPAKFSIHRANTGGIVVPLEVVPDLLYSCQVGDGCLDRGRDTQGDVAEHLLIMLIPAFCFISGMGSTENKPLALGPKIGLHHGGVPLLPVGFGEDWDHLVERTGHGDNSC